MPEKTKTTEKMTLDQYAANLQLRVSTLKSADVVTDIDDDEMKRLIDSIPDQRLVDGWGFTHADNKHTTAKDLLGECAKTVVSGLVTDFSQAKAAVIEDSSIDEKIKKCFSAVGKYLNLQFTVERRKLNCKQIRMISDVTEAIKSEKSNKDELIKKYDTFCKESKKIKKQLDEKKGQISKEINSIDRILKTLDDEDKIGKLQETEKKLFDEPQEEINKLKKDIQKLLDDDTPKPSAGDYDENGFNQTAYMQSLETKKQNMESINNDFRTFSGNVLSYKNRYVKSIAVLGDRVQDETKRDCDRIFKELETLKDRFETKYSEYMTPGREDAFAGIGNVKDRKEFDLILGKFDDLIRDCRTIYEKYKKVFENNKQTLDVIIDKLESLKEGKELPQPDATPDVSAQEPSKEETQGPANEPKTKGIIPTLKELLDEIKKNPEKAFELLSDYGELHKTATGVTDDQVNSITINLRSLKEYVKAHESSFGIRNHEVPIVPPKTGQMPDEETNNAFAEALEALTRYYDKSRRIHKDTSRVKLGAYKGEKNIRSDLMKKWMQKYIDRLDNYEVKNDKNVNCFLISKQAGTPAEAAMLEFRNAMYDARIDLYGLNPKKPGDITTAWNNLTAKTSIEKKLKEFKKNYRIKGRTEEIIYNLYAILKACKENEYKQELDKLKKRFNGISGMMLKLSGATIYPLKTQFLKLVDELKKFLELQYYEGNDEDARKKHSDLSLEEVRKSIIYHKK